jgi:hypothetical protein
MRGVALGRKNWIHIGSKQAGPRVAAILSVVESCRRLEIPIRDYLADILPGLSNTSIRQPAYNRVLSRYFPIAAKVRTQDAEQEPFRDSGRKEYSTIDQFEYLAKCLRWKKDVAAVADDVGVIF